MDYSFLDSEQYKDIPLLKIEDNRNGLPFFIQRYSLQQDHSSIFHRHEYIQVNYVFRGKGKHRISDHEFDIIKGDIFVIPPYVPHRIDSIPEGEIEIFEFEFTPGFVNQGFDTVENAGSFLDFAYIEPFLVSENQVKPRLNLAGKIQTEVEGILSEAFMEYKERNPGFMLLVKSLLLKLLVLVGREFTKGLEGSESFDVFNRYRGAILGAIKYINEYSGKDLNVDEVSRRFILSPSYFRYLFKNITSKTFTEFLNGVRIAKSLELLRTTDKKVLDISLETGFNNINHFNRVFRQHTGVTPLEYRKRGNADNR